jgi:hypothetical protein
MHAMAKPRKGSKGMKPTRKSAPKPQLKGVAAARKKLAADIAHADPSLFLPLSEGERADALRILLDDTRLRAMAKIGRYRVIAAEPLVVKPPDPLAGRRLARTVIVDYAGDRCVEACVDLDRSALCALQLTSAQPMLAPEEEAQALSVALADRRVSDGITLGDGPQAIMHYWSKRVSDLAHRRRSAAVVFGKPRSAPSLVAVVDLADGVVTKVVPAERW